MPSADEDTKKTGRNALQGDELKVDGEWTVPAADIEHPVFLTAYATAFAISMVHAGVLEPDERRDQAFNEWLDHHENAESIACLAYATHRKLIEANE